MEKRSVTEVLPEDRPEPAEQQKTAGVLDRLAERLLHSEAATVPAPPPVPTTSH